MAVRHFRHPVSGALRVFNAGAWTGVYGNPPGDTGAPPGWSIQPGFAEGTPNTVGEVITLDYGTASPEDAAVTAEIGTGSHVAATPDAGDYAGPLIPDGGTTPAAWLGLQPVARFTANHNRKSATIYVPLGQVIEPAVEPETPFPAALTSADWTAAEVRDAGPEGRRRITFLQSIAGAEGFELVLYSGPPPDTTQPQLGAVMAPPDSYTTNSSMAVGSECVNRLWWRRVSDGAFGNPSNTVSFTILGLSTAPNPPASDPALTPDLTVSYANLRSQIQAWIADWDGTIPSGKTAASDRILGWSGGNTSGTLDLRNLVNSRATRSSARIIVRPVGGTYHDDGCTVRHNGPVNFGGSRGIWLALAHVRTGGGLVETVGSNLCGMTRCLVEGAAPSQSSAAPGEYLVQVKECSNFTISHCLTSFANAATVLWWTSTGQHYFGNMVDYTPCDDTKVFWQFDNGLYERNWLSRRHCPLKAWDGSTPHADFFQHQGLYNRNNRFWGNVGLDKPGPVYPGAPYNRTLQCFFHKNETTTNRALHYSGTSWEQQITASALGQLIGTGGALSAGVRASYNTAITLGNAGNNNGAIIQGIAPTSNNFATVVGSQATADGAAGPNGIGLVIGNYAGGVSYRYYDALANYFEHGIPFQSADGTFKPFADMMLKAIRPKTGSRLHWGNSNPVGAHLRTREIFDTAYRATASAAAGYTVIPHAWPVLPVWRELYNADGYVEDDYTGAYDSNGSPA